MNLYLLSQTENDGWDTYNSVVVAAESEEIARHINPSSGGWTEHSGWAKTPDEVAVQLIGTAAPDIGSGVVLASFNAG